MVSLNLVVLLCGSNLSHLQVSDLSSSHIPSFLLDCSALDWPGFVAKCRYFVGGWGGVLHPLNVVLTGVLEQQMRGQLVLEQWEEAVGTGQLLTQAYK